MEERRSGGEEERMRGGEEEWRSGGVEVGSQVWMTHPMTGQTGHGAPRRGGQPCHTLAYPAISCHILPSLPNHGITYHHNLSDLQYLAIPRHTSPYLAKPTIVNPFPSPPNQNLARILKTIFIYHPKMWSLYILETAGVVSFPNSLEKHPTNILWEMGKEVNVWKASL